MAVPIAQKLLERAQRGEKLQARERRHAIQFLMATAPEVGLQAMADLFGVTTRMISLDKQRIRHFKAEDLKVEDIGLVIADIAMCFDRQLHDMEGSKAKCRLGTPAYVAHCKTIFDLQLRKVQALQDLGYYPKNLGNMTVDKFVFKAVVGKDQSVTTRDVSMEVEEQVDEEIIDVTAVPVSTSYEAEVAEREAQFKSL